MARRAVGRPRIPGVHGRRPGVLALLAAAGAGLRHSWIRPNSVLFLQIPGMPEDPKPEPEQQGMPSTVSVFQSLDTVEVKAGAILDAKVIRNLPIKGRRRVMLESSACNHTIRLDVPEETKLLEARNQLRAGGALKVRVKSVDFNASVVVAEIDEVVLKQWQDERKPPSAYENGTVVEAKVLSVARAKKGVTLVDIGCKEPARAEAPNNLLKVLRWNDTFTDVRVRVDSESGKLSAVLPNEAIAMLEARYKVIKEQNEKEQAQREKAQREKEEQQKQEEEEREKRRMEQKKKKEKKRKETRERRAAALPNITRAPKQDDVDFFFSFPDAPDGKMYKMALQGLRLDTVDMSKGTITVKVDQASEVQAEKAKEATEANEEKTQARTKGQKKWGKEVKKPLTEIYKGISEGDVITGRVEVKNRAGIWIALEGYDTTRHLRLKVPPNLIPKFDWKEELSNLTVASLTEEKSELVMPEAAMKETEERKREQMDPTSIKEGHVFAEGYVVNLIKGRSLLDVGLTNYVTMLGVRPLGTKLTDLKVTKVYPGGKKPENPFILVKAGKKK